MNDKDEGLRDLKSRASSDTPSSTPSVDRGPHIKAVEYAQGYVMSEGRTCEDATPLEHVMMQLTAQHYLAGFFTGRDAAPADGVSFDEQSGSFVARYTVLTAGRTEDEARAALASAVKLAADNWPPRSEGEA